jgi:hypothetical protein
VPKIREKLRRAYTNNDDASTTLALRANMGIEKTSRLKEKWVAITRFRRAAHASFAEIDDISVKVDTPASGHTLAIFLSRSAVIVAGSLSIRTRNAGRRRRLQSHDEPPVRRDL